MAKASALLKAPRAAKTQKPPRPAARATTPSTAPARRNNDLLVRFGFAAAVAMGAVLLAWRGSAPRVALPIPTPPPRPAFVAAAPPAPSATPTPVAITTPVPAPAPTVALAPVPIPAPSPTADAAATAENARMSPREEAAFNLWLIGSYKKCWSSPGAPPDSDPYLPKIRVAFKADGALAGAPRLVNPPSDPAWRPHADAALRAVKACDPLRVPEKYASYYRQWKTRTVYFDPAGP